MPLTVRKFNAQVKDPTSGDMIPAGLLSSDSLEAIEAAETAAVAAVGAKQAVSEAAIELKGATTLASIPADYTTLDNEVDDLKTQITDYTGNEAIVFTPGYIETSGTTADVTDIRTDSHYRCAVVDCSHGDQFVVSVKGATAGRAFAFIAEDGTVLYNANNNYTAEKQLLTAPVNSKWLVLNDNNTGKISFKNNSVVNIAKNNKAQLKNIADIQKFVIYNNTVLGTRFKTIPLGFPAGTYHIHVDRVDSSDTQFTSSRIIFTDGTSEGISLDINRVNGVDRDITFPNDVMSFTCYGAHSYNDSANVTFSYNNIIITMDTELNKRIEAIENDLTVKTNEITEINDRFIKEYIGKNIIGTRLKSESVNIPIGIYNLKVDSVTTNDSVETHKTSRMTFVDDNDATITKDINRATGTDEYIEFSVPIKMIYFYGVYNYNDSINIEFSFNGVSILGNLFKYIDNPINPYNGVVFSTDSKIKTTTHSHCTKQNALDNLMSQNLGALELSNYYPSNPTYTIQDCLNPEHPANLYPLSSIPTDKITTIPDVIQIPNAEHHGMTNVNWHITTPGSMFASGKSSGQTPVGIADTWQHAIAKIKRDLLYPDGGGTILNHPSSYPLQQILDALDYDNTVLGIEIFNDSGAHEHVDGYDYENTGDNPIGWTINKWDNVLKTGRRCWGFTVPDHRAEYTPDWRGSITVFVHEVTQENVLKAIRNGAFYAQMYHTSLALTDFVYSGNTVSITVNEESTIKAIINGEEFATTTGTSISINIPYNAVYVRFEISTENDTIYTNPLMLKKRVKVIPA